MPTSDPQVPPQDLERLFSAERLSTCIEHCGGDFAAAVEMYRWNSAITAAFWEPIGHLEVALRNVLDQRLAARHRRLERPDLASGFPHAPDRQLGTIEGPLARLHVFRNRLAHHQRVWSHAPGERYEDLLALAGYIAPALPGWIATTSRVPQTLSAKP